MISGPQYPRTIKNVICELAHLETVLRETGDTDLMPEIRGLERELNTLAGKPEADLGQSTLLCRVWDQLAVSEGIDLILGDEN